MEVLSDWLGRQMRTPPGRWLFKVKGVRGGHATFGVLGVAGVSEMWGTVGSETRQLGRGWMGVAE